MPNPNWLFATLIVTKALLAAPTPTEIFSAKLSPSNTFLITGEGFGTAPKARLAGNALVILSANNTGIEAKAPAGLTPGTYDLEVARNGLFGIHDKFDEIDIAVGGQGPQGPQGVAGPAGPQGPMGMTGATGAKGTTGATGSVGPQGPTGAQGAAGAQGPAGPKGDVGATGAAGAKGDVGAQGPVGLPGAAGAQGPVGPKGDIGDTGPAGPQGPQGPQGEKGLAGMNGVNGKLTVDGTAPGQVATWDGSNWIARQPPKVNVLLNNMQPYLVLNYEIALFGIYPSRSASDPFIGEIMIFAGNFAVNGWALCDGQLLSIAQNTALFSLLGTQYGGDGRVTFGLPDLRGRVGVHMGTGPGLTPRIIGESGGTETSSGSF